MPRENIHNIKSFRNNIATLKKTIKYRIETVSHRSTIMRESVQNDICIKPK